MAVLAKLCQLKGGHEYRGEQFGVRPTREWWGTAPEKGSEGQPLWPTSGSEIKRGEGKGRKAAKFMFTTHPYIYRDT